MGNLWPKFYPMFYRIITSKEDFFANYMEPDYGELTGNQLMAAIWLKEFINDASTDEIRSMTKFIAGSLRLPVDPKISISFNRTGNHTVEPEGRLPKAAVCAAELMLSDQYSSDEEVVFKQDLRTAFSYNEMFGFY